MARNDLMLKAGFYHSIVHPLCRELKQIIFFDAFCYLTSIKTFFKKSCNDSNLIKQELFTCQAAVIGAPHTSNSKC